MASKENRFRQRVLFDRTWKLKVEKRVNRSVGNNDSPCCLPWCWSNLKADDHIVIHLCAVTWYLMMNNLRHRIGDSLVYDLHRSRRVCLSSSPCHLTSTTKTCAVIYPSLVRKGQNVKWREQRCHWTDKSVKEILTEQATIEQKTGKNFTLRRDSSSRGLRLPPSFVSWWFMIIDPRKLSAWRIVTCLISKMSRTARIRTVSNYQSRRISDITPVRYCVGRRLCDGSNFELMLISFVSPLSSLFLRVDSHTLTSSNC